MKKVTLSFDLPENEFDCALANKASELYAVLRNLRSKIMFNTELNIEIPEPKKMVFREVFNMIEDELKANDIKSFFS